MENNIKTDIQDVEYVSVDWIGLAQDRERWRTLVSAVKNLRVPQNARNFLTGLDHVNFSIRTVLHAVGQLSRCCALLSSRYRSVM